VKVVLFCGGYGMRMRDGITSGPKPMSMIGDRPLLWHVMRYYAHFGHTDFILCLGYGGSHVKDYFLNYKETSSNDFVLSRGGRHIELLTSDIADWRIHFIDTGLNSTIGERLMKVRKYVADEEIFLANYADVLTDAPLPEIIDKFRQSDAVASLLAVSPQSSFHVAQMDEECRINEIRPVNSFPMWENGGYFVLRPEIFEYLVEGEDMVDDAFRRLAAENRMIGHPYSGFWHSADTLKERAQLERLFQGDQSPWALWDESRQQQNPRWEGPERRHDARVSSRDLEMR